MSIKIKNGRGKSGLIEGVGINDADYNVSRTEVINGVQKLVWRCPFYRKWHHVLVRCYNFKFQSSHPTYKDCSICEEWLYFSNFKAWMETQDWEGKQLDKDILVKGNKIYSPETCVFVEPKLNNFIIDSEATRGEWPIGVVWHKRHKKFAAICRSAESGKPKYLGYYNTPEEAHRAWLEYKVSQAYFLAAQQTDQRIAEALIDRYENYLNINPDAEVLKID